MSMPVGQQSPLVTVAQPSINTHSTHASIGPVIAVLVVIMILGILAIMIGRLCSGRRIMGYGQYDIDSWAEMKCSSCIDGRISPPPAATRPGISAPASMPAQTHQETEVDQSPQQSNATADS